MKMMGLTAEEYEALKAVMFDAKSDEIRDMPEEHLYIRYMIEQSINLENLSKMIKEFRESKQYSAMVNAIRTRSDILDKIVAKGQEFGLIKKTPDRKEVVAGLIVGELSNNQLREGITHAIKHLDGLTKMYGKSKSFMELEAPKEIHHGPELPTLTAITGEPPKKKARNSKAKVFKGRRKRPAPAPIPVESADKD